MNQLNTLATAVEAGSASERTQKTDQRSAAINTVISGTEKAEQRLVEARKKTTVFFQFAGGLREQAQALAAALETKGYIVPGEDRQGGAAGKHEVRYFHADDQEAAINLANDTTAALESLGYPEGDAFKLAARSFVSYRGKKPRGGVIELWLEIPPR